MTYRILDVPRSYSIRTWFNTHAHFVYRLFVVEQLKEVRDWQTLWLTKKEKWVYVGYHLSLGRAKDLMEAHRLSNKGVEVVYKSE